MYQQQQFNLNSKWRFLSIEIKNNEYFNTIIYQLLHRIIQREEKRREEKSFV